MPTTGHPGFDHLKHLNWMIKIDFQDSKRELIKNKLNQFLRIRWSVEMI